MSKPFEPYSGNEDHALFLLIRQRDKKAFATVYQKYHGYLYAIALRYLKSREMAEDAVQHVFVKLWESTARIEIEINLKNYLYTMTKNHILNQIRDRKEIISINYANAQKEIPDNDEFLEKMEQQRISQALYSGIEQLPAQKKAVCMMKMEENASNQEIADKMGISIHTVKSHYQESIKLLRSYFNKIKLMLF